MIGFGKFIFWLGAVLSIVTNIVVFYASIVQGNDNPFMDLYIIPIGSMVAGIGMAYFSREKEADKS